MFKRPSHRERRAEGGWKWDDESAVAGIQASGTEGVELKVLFISHPGGVFFGDVGKLQDTSAVLTLLGLTRFKYK